MFGMKTKQTNEPPVLSATETPKQRKCLTCREPFESEWTGNRICKRCKASAAWRQGG